LFAPARLGEWTEKWAVPVDGTAHAVAAGMRIKAEETQVSANLFNP
jgi:hypothetical protein